MTTPQSPSTSSSSPSEQNQSALRSADYLKFKRYAAYTFLIASPILIALPPRKLDLYTVSLTGAFAVSGEYLYREKHNGQGIGDALRRRAVGRNTAGPASSLGEAGIADAATSSPPASTTKKTSSFNLFRDLPSDRAQEVQAKLRVAQEIHMREGTAVSEELEKLKRRHDEQRQSEKSIVERIWIGNETEGWKERRLREEQKALNEGKGYGDLIMEHIWDVWTWGKNKSPPSDQDGVARLAETPGNTGKTAEPK
jgi:hypothetical protein